MPAPILALPLEIQFMIGAYLGLFDIQVLRMVHHLFRSIFPAATYDQLLEFNWKSDRLVCFGCITLRPMKAFPHEMIIFHKHPPESKAPIRICKECAPQILHNRGFKFFLHGHWWTFRGVTYVRCFSCLMIREGAEERDVRVCLPCREEDAKSGGDGVVAPPGTAYGKNGVLFIQCLRCGGTGKDGNDRPWRLCESCHRDSLETEYARRICVARKRQNRQREIDARRQRQNRGCFAHNRVQPGDYWSPRGRECHINRYHTTRGDCWTPRDRGS